MSTPEPVNPQELSFAASQAVSTEPGVYAPVTAQTYTALRLPPQPYTRVAPDGTIIWQSTFRDALDTQRVGWAFYDDVLIRYCHAGAVFRKRVQALTALPLTVRPPRHLTTPAARARAQRTQETIYGIRNISRSLGLLIETWLLKGFAPTQIVPGPRKGQLRIGIDELLWLDPTMVLFRLDGHMLHRDSVGAWTGTDLTAARPGQFFAPAFRGTPSNPYGLGLGEDFLRPFWLTVLGAVRAWAAGCERLGIPIRDVAVPEEIIASQAKYDKVKADAASLNRDAVFVHDDRIKFMLAQANTAGMADTFEKFCRFVDESVSKIALGETLTTDTAVRGSSEVATGHREVRQEVRDADAAALAEWLTESLVAYIEQVNEGVDQPGDFSQVVIGAEMTAPTGAELTAAAQTLALARREGVPVSVQAWRRLGVPEIGPDDELLPPVVPGPDALQFAENGVPAQRRALEAAAVRPMIAPYRGLLDDLTRDLAGKA